MAATARVPPPTVLLLLLLVVFGEVAEAKECADGAVYDPKGGLALPPAPVTGPICGVGSCCGPHLEMKLLSDTKNDLDQYLNEAITRISSILDTRARKFDEIFRDLLQKSKRDFHEMFKKTYGLIYLQHVDVFTDFFTNLERYFKTGQVALSETIEKFFNILYIRMFTVMNSQYDYDVKYLKCVEKFMNDLKPFGDIPQKFRLQLTRSFVATKVLYKTLSGGAAVAHSMRILKTSDDCGRKLVQLRHCGLCTNQKDRLPCSSYCTRTLQNCLEQFGAISDHWDNFVDGVDKISDRLLGPFNIEAVVEPINIKISEAIMNFQESGSTISERIFVSCGKPTLERRRRSPSPKGKVRDDEVTNQNNFSSKKKHGKKPESSTTLEKIIRDIKQKVKETKLFWKQLPYQYCNEEGTAAKPSQEDSCWNGTAPTNIGNLTNTPLSTKDPFSSTTSPHLQEAIQELKTLSGTLFQAHQGQEIDVPEPEEEMDFPSGSGSGDDDSRLDQEEDDDDEDPDSRNEDTDEEVRRIWPESSSSTRKPISSPADPVTSPPAAGGASRVMFNGAIVSYVLPIILVWFGGALADLL